MEFSRSEGDFKDDHSSNGSLENDLKLDIDKFQSISEAGDKKPMNKHKMTIFQTSLAFLCTSIGGGILGMPFAFFRMGLFLGIICCFFIGILSHFANVMYLKVKDLTPRK